MSGGFEREPILLGAPISAILSVELRQPNCQALLTASFRHMLARGAWMHSIQHTLLTLCAEPLRSRTACVHHHMRGGDLRASSP